MLQCLYRPLVVVKTNKGGAVTHKCVLRTQSYEI